jgi:NAD(P)-dependent dehydrogenase (short-subunit alcohol dehydrogenase family)
MTDHPALAEGRAAVITGAASGIGLAAARRFAAMGLRVCLADLSEQALERAAGEVAAAAPTGKAAVIAVPTDVSRLEDVQKLRDTVYAAFGEVAVLMNNAGTSPGGGPWEHIDRWRRVLEVNLWGIINGVQSFTPRMLEQGTACAIINTGSKQGITCPPGDTAYNVSKAGVKVLTEALAHSLRNAEGSRITAHLLIPGSTFRDDKPRAHRKAGRRVAARSGGGPAYPRRSPRRFLRPLPRQRRDAGDRQSADSLGRAGHHREPARPVALASRLRSGICAVPCRSMTCRALRVVRTSRRGMGLYDRGCAGAE